MALSLQWTGTSLMMLMNTVAEDGISDCCSDSSSTKIGLKY